MTSFTIWALSSRLAPPAVLTAAVVFAAWLLWRRGVRA